jgi:hypothetical protein
MGKIKGPYEADFPEGSLVQTADRTFLERFNAEWRHHNKIQAEQIDFAGVRARVKSVTFYHGGDELYVLEGVPGVWHEQCLREAQE